jgi:hypothetical protein
MDHEEEEDEEDDEEAFLEEGDYQQVVDINDEGT